VVGYIPFSGRFVFERSLNVTGVWLVCAWLHDVKLDHRALDLHGAAHWSPRPLWSGPSRGKSQSFGTPDWRHVCQQHVEKLIGEALSWPACTRPAMFTAKHCPSQIARLTPESRMKYVCL
jgi:hypothetical protein